MRFLSVAPWIYSLIPMISYYLAKPGSTQEGPFTEDELEELYRQRALSSDSYVWSEGWDQWRLCEDAFKWFIARSNLPPLPPGFDAKGMPSSPDVPLVHDERDRKTSPAGKIKSSETERYRNLSDRIQHREVLNQIHQWGLRALQVKGQTYGINHYTVCAIGVMLMIVLISLGTKKPADSRYVSDTWIQRNRNEGNSSDYQWQQMVNAANKFHENNTMDICNKCGGSGVVTPGSGRALWNRAESSQYRMTCPQCGGAGEVQRSRNAGRFNDGTYQGSGW